MMLNDRRLKVAVRNNFSLQKAERPTKKFKTEPFIGRWGNGVCFFRYQLNPSSSLSSERKDDQQILLLWRKIISTPCLIFHYIYHDHLPFLTMTKLLEIRMTFNALCNVTVFHNLQTIRLKLTTFLDIKKGFTLKLCMKLCIIENVIVV